MGGHGDAWRRLLPPRLRELPLGGDLVRTEPGRDPGAPIAVLASRAELRVTPGNEAAAFVRGDASVEQAQPRLHRDPVVLEVLGRSSIRVVHLPHPGVVMRSSAWRARHSTWCRDHGHALVRELLR